MLSVRPDNCAEVLARFAARGIAAARVGNVESGSRLWLKEGSDQALLWDHAEQPFIGTSVGTSAA